MISPSECGRFHHHHRVLDGSPAGCAADRRGTHLRHENGRWTRPWRRTRGRWGWQGLRSKATKTLKCRTPLGFLLVLLALWSYGQATRQWEKHAIIGIPTLAGYCILHKSLECSVQKIRPTTKCTHHGLPRDAIFVGRSLGSRSPCIDNCHPKWMMITIFSNIPFQNGLKGKCASGSYFWWEGRTMISHIFS